VCAVNAVINNAYDISVLMLIEEDSHLVSSLEAVQLVSAAAAGC
jgi:hypothetical protein